MSSLRELLSELKRRRVYRVAIVYAAVAFVLWQVADIAFPSLGLPETAVTLVLVLTVLGFPVALVLAWAYELRPEEPARGTPAEEESPASATEDAEPTPAPSAVPPDGSIAILPFENMSTEDESEYFADGISEELTHALGRLPALRVAARTSAFSLKGRQLDARDIGARLNVAHIVEGSVRRSGDRLRVTAQLIDARDGYHVWSDRFERELDDVFAIQDDIVEALVTSLVGRLALAPEDEPPTLTRTEHLGTYDLYLKGRHELRQFDVASVQRAVDLFEKAIDLDPDFAPASASLAEALTTQAIGFVQGTARGILPRARKAADRALVLDPTLPEAHVAKGLSLLYHDWSFREARAELEEAVRLNPSHVDAHRWAEFYWTYVEHDYEEARAALARVRALDPLDPRLAVREGTVEYVFGHYAEAEAIYRQLLEPEAPTPIVLIGLMDTLHRAGRRAEAAAIARGLPVGDEAPNVVLGVSGLVLAASGGDDEAKKRLHVLESRRERGYSLAFWRAVIHAGLGDLDEAFALLEEAVDERDGGLLFLVAAPQVRGLQGDPRYAKLLRRVGLGHLVDVVQERARTFAARRPDA